MKRFMITFFALFLLLVLSATLCFAATDTTGNEKSNDMLAFSIRYIAAALAVGLCAIATSIAQSRIGAAGMGSIVEKPETTGTVIICIAIPETMVILGFVVAAMIIIL